MPDRKKMSEAAPGTKPATKVAKRFTRLVSPTLSSGEAAIAEFNDAALRFERTVAEGLQTIRNQRASYEQMVSGHPNEDGPTPVLSALRGFMDQEGVIAFDRVASELQLSRAQLAEAAGLRREVLQKSALRESQRVQGRVREMLEIIGRVVPWAGGWIQAMAWYRAEPLPAFGGRTAESLVKGGDAASVRNYLDHIARGGFA